MILLKYYGQVLQRWYVKYMFSEYDKIFSFSMNCKAYNCDFWLWFEEGAA